MLTKNPGELVKVRRGAFAKRMNTHEQKWVEAAALALVVSSQDEEVFWDTGHFVRPLVVFIDGVLYRVPSNEVLEIDEPDSSHRVHEW